MNDGILTLTLQGRVEGVTKLIAGRSVTPFQPAPFMPMRSTTTFTSIFGGTSRTTKRTTPDYRVVEQGTSTTQENLRPGRAFFWSLGELSADASPCRGKYLARQRRVLRSMSRTWCTCLLLSVMGKTAQLSEWYTTRTGRPNCGQ